MRNVCVLFQLFYSLDNFLQTWNLILTQFKKQNMSKLQIVTQSDMTNFGLKKLLPKPALMTQYLYSLQKNEQICFIKEKKHISMSRI